MITRRLSAAVLSLALAAGLAACSNREASINKNSYPGTTTAASAAGTQTVTLKVGSDFRFVPSSVTVHPGKVTVVIDHMGTMGAPHDFQIEGYANDRVPLTSAGQTMQATFTAPPPGTYTFVCTIHIEQGMTGTLTVLPS